MKEILKKFGVKKLGGLVLIIIIIIAKMVALAAITVIVTSVPIAITAGRGY